MGNPDSRSTQHKNIETPFRKDNVFQIINDMAEEISATGFTEIIKSGVFVDKITNWKTSSKLIKRAEIVVNRSGPFVTSVVREIFDEELGTIKKATTTLTLTRDSNNLVIDSTSVTTRP